MCSILLVCSLSANAQPKTALYNAGIYIYPQYFIVNGLRSDLHFSADNGLGITVGLMMFNGKTNKDGNRNKANYSYYFSNDPLRNEDYASSFGYSIAATHVINFDNNDGNYITRQLIGIEFSTLQTNINFYEYAYVPKTIDDLIYYTFELENFRESAYQAGAGAYYMVEFIWPYVALNLKVGGMQKWSTQSENLKTYKNYDKKITDFAYSGFVPQALVGIGIFIK